MSDTIEAHGGTLVNRVLEGDEREQWISKVDSLKSITASFRVITDLELISNGAMSPLEGFMKKDDYQSVVQSMRLANGLPWSLPVKLPVSSAEAAEFQDGDDIILKDGAGNILAVLHLEEKYTYDKKKEAELVYKTTDEAHPGVAVVYEQGDVLLGGKISLINHIKDIEFVERRLEPRKTRDYFNEKGWKTVVAFQTRNPIHRAHEYLQKCALEMVDGLLIHPVVGETKSDDIPADIRMRCYEALIENYFPDDRVLLSVLPASMRYAGPREAIFHALLRKNYGCTHFIVGRDHAGVGNYYGTYDAHHIFSEFSPEEIGITPIFFDHSFYCKRCGGMASSKTCGCSKENHVFLSGTKVREMLSDGQDLPAEFTRPEVSKVLMEAYK
ncbi:MAG: sulfate adenylyltransferase [Bacteroidetes bacterium]|nr:sulfate adenylyltransferase [Bacteroidota bacterium]